MWSVHVYCVRCNNKACHLTPPTFLLPCHLIPPSPPPSLSSYRDVSPTSMPLNEVKKWQHRLVLLTSIVAQVKSRDCNAVLTVLVAAKSRQLKKWKTLDAK